MTTGTAPPEAGRQLSNHKMSQVFGFHRWGTAQIVWMRYGDRMTCTTALKVRQGAGTVAILRRDMLLYIPSYIETLVIHSTYLYMYVFVP